MRKKIVAGNWKMNKTLEEAIKLADDIFRAVAFSEKREVIVIPPFPYLSALGRLLSGTEVQLGAQQCASNVYGAFTGEVSAPMLKSCGVQWVLAGHSERRIMFGENSETVSMKVRIALQHHLNVIWCCGESLENRQSSGHFDVVGEQIMSELNNLSASDWDALTIAYEPVWAIGTGQTASPDQAQEMHAFIREMIRKIAGNAKADSIRILYGGSCNPENAEALFALPDVDGGLIGGASLKSEQFLSILTAADK